MDGSNCVFCKIVAGDIPALCVLDAPDVLAFLDAHPLAPGHTLLIPKRHYRDILDVPADVLGTISGHLPRLAGAVMRSTGATGLNILQNNGQSSGQAVFHLHIHLVPRREGDGLGYRWNAGAYAEGEAAAWQSRIISALKAEA